MGDAVEFVYNTRLRSRSLSVDFYSRPTNALVIDMQQDNPDQDEEAEAIDQFDDGDHGDADYVPNEDASDIEEDVIIEPNEIFDSDEEIVDETEEVAEVNVADRDDGFFYGKDGTKWSKNEPSTATRVRQHNIMRFRSGPRQQNSIPMEVFKKFFTPNISFIIITETNRHGRESTRKWNEDNPDSKPRIWNNLTSTELDAFIGILLAAGVSHNNMQISEVLWRSDALPIFRAAMSYRRFKQLSRYIRFDDSRTREFRQQSDKAAPIRDIWNFLNENLASNYDAHDVVTVDEQLFPYRGRTKFTQYIPSKPAKYGIKVWWACDAKTKYPLQGKLYTGKEGDEREVNQGENVLMQLSNRYSMSGRTMVGDNFFITLNAAKRLAAIGLALVGTIRSNKTCIPPEMKKHVSRPVLSSLFGFHENVSICSYVPKKNRAVNLLSTVHYSKLCEGEAQKPEAIIFYNAHKAGVNSMDQMVSHFTTKRPTRRWTYAFFCNMLDIMALAAYCICKEVDGYRRNDARRTFLNKLANTLVLANVENRMNNPHFINQFTTRLAVEAFFGKQISLPTNAVVGNKAGADTLTNRRDCRLCLQGDEKLRRKTRFFCAACNHAVCQQHSKIAYTCFACVSQIN